MPMRTPDAPAPLQPTTWSRLELRRAVLGELPLWNPYHFSGHPSVADPQSLLFTPTMLLFAWLVPSPSMQLFDGVVFAHFVPGALAILMLFRRRGWAPAGAVIAAMIL